MKLDLSTGMQDQTTSAIADALDAPFEKLSRKLSKDYGGTMKHLWIDFELCEYPYTRRTPWPFRFQKKVGGSSPNPLTGLPTGVWENVGHYSVQPDRRELLRVPKDLVVGYALSLVYASTSVLIEKQKKLGGFDAERFRADFLKTCQRHGYDIDPAVAQRK